MKTNRKLALALLAGMSIRVAGAEAVRAQQGKTPPGYVVGSRRNRFRYNAEIWRKGAGNAGLSITDISFVAA